MLLGISVEAFMDSLPKMGWGMLGVFIVTAIIVLSIYLLNTLFSRK